MRHIRKHDVMVLYQIDADIFNPVDIMDIIDIDLEEVKESIHALREMGLIRTEKRSIIVTKHGKDVLQHHKKWAVGL